MKFWMRFFPGEKHWLAYSPDFDGTTQGETLEEARQLATDWLTNHLEDTWSEGQELPAKLLTPETAVLPPEQKGTTGDQWIQVEIPPKAVFALTIKRERIKRGKTLRSAAADLNVALGTYQRWENPRKFNATFETMESVARSFGKVLQVSMTD